MSAEKLTEAELREIAVTYGPDDASWPDTPNMLHDQRVQRLLDEHAALTAELKRARIQQLNADSECAELRAELRETRRKLEEALGRWP